MSLRRVAILGASTLAGREVDGRLRERRIPAGAIIACEPGSESNVLAARDGDLVVMTADVADALDGADVGVICTALSEADVGRARNAAEQGAILLDLTGTLGGRAFDPFSGATLGSLGAGVHSVPAASATLLNVLVRTAREAGGRAPLVATCCEPASELGRGALDELFAQALAAIQFGPLPTEVLGRQWVHDIVSPGKEGEAREARLRREVADISGEASTSLVVMRAGVFHGAAVFARADVSAAAWAKALRGQKLLEVAGDDDEASSPASAARSERAVVGRITDDAAGGAWVFAVADSLAFGSVGGAVAVLERSMSVP